MMGKLVKFVIWSLALLGLAYVLIAVSSMGAEEMSRW